MNLRYSTITAIALAGLLSLNAPMAVAQDNHDGYKNKFSKMYGDRKGHKRKGLMSKRLLKKLDLSEAQKAEVKNIREVAKSNMQPLREEARAIREASQNLDPNSANYQANVAALADRKAQLTRQKFVQKMEVRRQFLNVLNAEQRVKLTELKAKRKAKMEEKKLRREQKSNQ